MNPSIQWEEDWFTITPSDQEQQEQEQPKHQEQEQPNHQEQEQPNHQEQIQDLYHRLEQLSLLVQAQSEQITLLQRELREQQQPHTAASDIAALLEELKRVKERELNLALRRHQPVPFFDSGMLQRIVPYHNLFRTTATKL